MGIQADDDDSQLETSQSTDDRRGDLGKGEILGDLRHSSGRKAPKAEELDVQGRDSRELWEKVKDHDKGGRAQDHDDHDTNGDTHHHVEEPPNRKNMTLLSAWLLLIFMCLLMSFVYLTNSPDSHIRAWSNKVFSLILAIFCALLIEKAQHNCILGAVEVSLGHYPSHAVEFCIMFCLYLAWTLAITAASKYYSADPPRLFAFVEGIVTHVAAFVGIEMVNVPLYHLAHHQVEHHESATHLYLHESATHLYLIALFLWVAWTFLMNRFMTFVRERCLGAGSGPPAHGEQEAQAHRESTPTAVSQEGNENGKEAQAADREIVDNAPSEERTRRQSGDAADIDILGVDEDHFDSHHHMWHHIAHECELESCAIVFGTLFNNFVWILTYPESPKPLDCDVASLEGNPCPDPSASSWVMYSSMAALLVVSIIMLCRIQLRYKDNHSVSEFCEVAESFVCFSYAWVMLTLVGIMSRIVKRSILSKRLAVGWQCLVGKKAMVFVIWWPFFVLLLLISDKLADVGFLKSASADRIVQGLSLATAVIIEAMYGVAIDSALHALFPVDSLHNPWKESCGLLLFVTFFLCLILPAWIKYIVPVAMMPMAKRETDQKSLHRKTRARFAQQKKLLNSHWDKILAAVKNDLVERQSG